MVVSWCTAARPDSIRVSCLRYRIATAITTATARIRALSHKPRIEADAPLLTPVGLGEKSILTKLAGLASTVTFPIVVWKPGELAVYLYVPRGSARVRALDDVLSPEWSIRTDQLFP